MKPFKRERSSRTGSTMIEFALASLLLVPLTMGVAGLGLTLGSFISVVQTTRDAAHMFARGIDFDTNANKDLIVRLASGLNLTRTGGNGTIIFSKVVTPRNEDCIAANVLGGNCTNRDNAVVIHRTRIGDPALLTSHYGTPAANLVASTGNIQASDYLTNTSVRAGSITTELAAAGIAQERGDIAYVVEGYFTVPAFRFLGYAQGGMYCRFMF